MELEKIMNSPMLWIVSSFMVIVVLCEAAIFMRQAFKSAQKMGIPRSECMMGMRAAMITAIGPAFSPVIVLIALMAVLGGPTAWMRMNDIGAARTELAMSTIATGMVGSSLEAGKMTLMGFIFALWGMALNNSGWIVVGGYSGSYMRNAVDYMKRKFDANWIKLLMAAAALGLFGSLLSNSVITRGSLVTKNLFAGVVSFIAMTIISYAFRGNQRIQEFSLGLAMLIGMYTAAALY